MKLTKDKHTILFHDEEFGRTVKQTGKVGEYELSQLLTFDAGSWHSHERFIKEPIAQFSSVLDYCRRNAVWMNVEIKPEINTDLETGRIVAEQIQQSFADEITAYRDARDAGNEALARDLLHKLPLISSFSFTALMTAKVVAPDVPRAFLIDDLAKTVDWRQKLVDLDAVAVHTNVKTLTQSNADEIKDRGYALMCYTVNTQEDHQRLLGYGVDSICTDKLEIFKYLTSLNDFMDVPAAPLPLGEGITLDTPLPTHDGTSVSSVFSSFSITSHSKSTGSLSEQVASALAPELPRTLSSSLIASAK